MMYIFELQDMLFTIKSIKSPINQFNINYYIKFSHTTSTRSGASNKLIPPRHINNISHHSYFHRLPYLWNSMPTFDLNMLFCRLKTNICGNTSNQTLISNIIVLSTTLVHAPNVTYQDHLLSTLTAFNHVILICSNIHININFFVIIDHS